MNVTNPNTPQVWNSMIFKIYKIVENKLGEKSKVMENSVLYTTLLSYYV